MAAHLFHFFFIAQQISFRALSLLLTQKDSPCEKKLLIITPEMGNSIRINKGEITVIMLGLMGPARNQGENTTK